MSIYLTVALCLAFTLTMLDWMAYEEFPGPFKVFMFLLVGVFFPIVFLYMLLTISDKEDEE